MLLQGAEQNKEWAVLATALVLVAALLHATWNTLIKFSAERLLVVACMDTVALLFVALMLPFRQRCRRWRSGRGFWRRRRSSCSIAIC